MLNLSPAQLTLSDVIREPPVVGQSPGVLQQLFGGWAVGHVGFRSQSRFETASPSRCVARCSIA